MRAGTQFDVSLICTQIALIPIINDDVSVYPDAHTIIHRGFEAICTCGKLVGANPASGKIIDIN